MEKSEFLVDEDAKRVDALTNEILEVCKKRGWPVVSAALVSQPEEKGSVVCIGAQHAGSQGFAPFLDAGIVGYSVYLAQLMLTGAAEAQSALSKARSGCGE